MSSKYQPLAEFLAAQPAETGTVTLTLADVETVIGAPLPSAAWTSTWWTNSGVRSHHAPWVAAGWRVASRSLRRAPGTITFERLPPETLA